MMETFNKYMHNIEQDNISSKNINNNSITTDTLLAFDTNIFNILVKIGFMVGEMSQKEDDSILTNHINVITADLAKNYSGEHSKKELEGKIVDIIINSGFLADRFQNNISNDLFYSSNIQNNKEHFNSYEHKSFHDKNEFERNNSDSFVDSADGDLQDEDEDFYSEEEFKDVAEK